MASELTSLKEDLGETLGSKSRVSLMSLAAMEKIQARCYQRGQGEKVIKGDKGGGHPIACLLGGINHACKIKPDPVP